MQRRTRRRTLISFFFFNDTATTEIYTLSLHDALPISPDHAAGNFMLGQALLQQGDQTGVEYLERAIQRDTQRPSGRLARSEEHTSELQSRSDLVCRLLLEKKKKSIATTYLVYHSIEPL